MDQRRSGDCALLIDCPYPCFPGTDPTQDPLLRQDLQFPLHRAVRTPESFCQFFPGQLRMVVGSSLRVRNVLFIPYFFDVVIPSVLFDHSRFFASCVVRFAPYLQALWEGGFCSEFETVKAPGAYNQFLRQVIGTINTPSFL